MNDDLDKLISLIEAYFAEDGLDAQERVVIEDVRTKLQKLAAGREKTTENALGVTAQHKFLARAQGPGGAY